MSDQLRREQFKQVNEIQRRIAAQFFGGSSWMALTFEDIKHWHANPINHGTQIVFSPLNLTCAMCWLIKRVQDLEKMQQETETRAIRAELAYHGLERTGRVQGSVEWLGICVECGGQYSDLSGHRQHAHGISSVPKSENTQL